MVTTVLWNLSFKQYFFSWIVTVSLALCLPIPIYAQQVALPIAFHRQEHSLSCEVAALKMALGVHGISVSEKELIGKLAFDPTPKGNGIWGDPNKGFVGSIDGRMLATGYGVYWDPIAKLGNKYAATEVLRHGSAQNLAQEISNGNPVIIWGYYGKRNFHSWRTPAGKTIKAIDGEHTIVVYGFDGSVKNPTRFYLMDPFHRKIIWTTEELMHNWSSLDHMGVIVKPARAWVRLPNGTDIWELHPATKTRHFITTWKAFTDRGGTKNAVKNMNEDTLLTYTNGSPIHE